MSWLSCTPEPSSVNSRTPSSASSAIGESCSPARPMDMAAAGWTSQSALAPRSCTSRTTEALSIVGVVFGMATTAVKPPSAAHRLPVSTVSASSRPG